MQPSDLWNARWVRPWLTTRVCLPQALDARPGHRPRTRRALDGGGAAANVVGNDGAEAEGVGWARARCPAQRAGELGAHVGWRMRVAVGHAFARSMIGLRCPCSSLRLAPKGPGGSDRRYGMLRARNAKTVLAHHFLYLIVVRSRSKNGPLPRQIPRTEFLLPFQDSITAGASGRVVL